MLINAQLVKKLRNITGYGIMECKKFLIQTNGNIEKSIEEMRKQGKIKALAKSSNITSEGVILTSKTENKVGMIEIKSQTDFVARSKKFQDFAKKIINIILKKNIDKLETLLKTKFTDKQTIEEARQELITIFEENIQITRISLIACSHVNYYNHNNKIGVILSMQGGDSNLSKDISMHIAACNPMVINKNQIPQNIINKEKEIFLAQAITSTKNEKIIEKIIDGKLKKFINDNSLYGQIFIKNNNKTIEDILKIHNAQIKEFRRFSLGEII